MSKCKSCGSRIIWMTTKSGKKMPVDWDQEIEAEVEFDPDRMESHFGSCPHAEEMKTPK